MKSNDWESGAVFNCAALFRDNTVHLLYRAIGEYKIYISRLGHAFSSDGFNFQRSANPVLFPEGDMEQFGCDDPRSTEIDGNVYFTF